MDDAARRDTARDLHDKLIRYWHDVDFNWGRNAARYYTEDAIFEGENTHYSGRKEIEEFYAFRRDRGPRVVLHAVVNYICDFASDTEATCEWVCLLHAHDGERPQDAAPPINISLVTDKLVLQHGAWLVKRRTWLPLFQGGVPGTNLSRSEMEQRLATKPS